MPIFQLFQQLFDPVKEMGARFAVLQSALAALNKISNAVNIELPENSGDKEMSEHDIKISNLSFEYLEGRASTRSTKF